jgi:isovaleryl-CoA dehydrogenase
VESFARSKIQPLAGKIDAENRFPNYLWRELGTAGYLGITAPRDYGGSELKFSDHCIAVEEISRQSGSIGLSYAVHSHLVVNQLVRKGSEVQRKRFLPKLISGESVGCIAISEVCAGSDVVSMKTVATRRSPSSFILNGSKMWITNGPDADIMIVYAKTDPGAGARGISAFIVDAKNSSGSIIRGPHLDKMGMRGSNTCELTFKDVEVPAENLIGEVNKGVYVLMAGLDLERLIMASAPVGMMKACLNDVVLPYVHQREQFGQRIGEFQLMQAKIADMYTRLRCSESFLRNLSRAADDTSTVIDKKDAASLIHVCSQNAIWVAMESIQALGGLGYTRDVPVERILRDAKMYEIGGGTTEIRKMLIGRDFNEQFLGKKKASK